MKLPVLALKIWMLSNCTMQQPWARFCILKTWGWYLLVRPVRPRNAVKQALGVAFLSTRQAGSKGHPIGATGLGQIYELVTQLRGEAGARQVEGARHALHQNSGGQMGVEEAAVSVSIFAK